MPQAKARFVVVGKFIDAKGQPVKAGSLIDLEVDKEGKPVDALVASRVKPFKGEVIGGGTDIIADAQAQAAAILKAAGEEAERIINEATKAKK
jgi:hypothetical protein